MLISLLNKNDKIPALQDMWFQKLWKMWFCYTTPTQNIFIGVLQATEIMTWWYHFSIIWTSFESRNNDDKLGAFLAVQVNELVCYTVPLNWESKCTVRGTIGRFGPSLCTCHEGLPWLMSPCKPLKKIMLFLDVSWIVIPTWIIIFGMSSLKTSLNIGSDHGYAQPLGIMPTQTTQSAWTGSEYLQWTGLFRE